MSDNYFNNLDSREKANLFDALGASQSASGTFVDVAGDTMTGLLNGTGITMTGTASLAAANISTLSGANVAYTGTASLATANIPTLAGANIAYTGTASLAKADIPAFSSSAAVLSSTASIAGIRAYSTIATQNAVFITSTILGSATIAPLAIVASTASQAFISFSGVFISSASYSPGGANAFVIPVYHESERIWGYIGASKALV